MERDFKMTLETVGKVESWAASKKKNRVCGPSLDVFINSEAFYFIPITNQNDNASKSHLGQQNDKRMIPWKVNWECDY